MKERTGTINFQAAALGAGVGMLSMVVLCAAGAGLMAKGAVSAETMGLWAAGILVGSGLLGGLTARLGGGGRVEAGLTAVGELVVLIAVNLLLNEGKMEGFAVTVLALAGGCGAALLLMAGRGGGRRNRRRRRRKS